MTPPVWQRMGLADSVLWFEGINITLHPQAKGWHVACPRIFFRKDLDESSLERAQVLAELMVRDELKALLAQVEAVIDARRIPF